MAVADTGFFTADFGGVLGIADASVLGGGFGGIGFFSGLKHILVIIGFAPADIQDDQADQSDEQHQKDKSLQEISRNQTHGEGFCPAKDRDVFHQIGICRAEQCLIKILGLKSVVKKRAAIRKPKQ